MSLKVLQEPYYWSAYSSFITRLESLALSWKKGYAARWYSRRVQSACVIQRWQTRNSSNTCQNLPYHHREGRIDLQGASYARVQGDALTSAPATNKEQRAQFEDIFNEKQEWYSWCSYWGSAHFSWTVSVGWKTSSRFAFHRNLKKKVSRTLARWEPQRLGLRFLGANGNSGLLAHEVGFGKLRLLLPK